MATGIWRAASINRTAISRLAGSAVFASRYAFRIAKPIGSGNHSAVRAMLQNRGAVQSSGLSLPGNTCTISSLYLESIALGVSVPMTIAGSSSAVMADGDYNLQTDSVLPSAFGLTQFTRDEMYAVRGFIDIPISGNVMRCTQNDFTSISACRMYDGQGGTPTVTCTNISGTGALTFSGSTTNVDIPSVSLIGTFVTGDPPTYLGMGDSIKQGRVEAGSTVGAGYFCRALYNGGTNVLAGFDWGVTGSTYVLWTTSTQTAAYMRAAVPFCNVAHYEFGVNSFASAGAANDPTALAVVLAADRALWTQTRADGLNGTVGARAFQIIGHYLLPRTTGSWGDAASQATFGPQWDISGDVDSYNASHQADVGVAGRLDYIFNSGSTVRADPSSSANLDYHKFAAGPLTDDGVHLLALGHTNVAVLLRALYDTITDPPTILAVSAVDGSGDGGGGPGEGLPKHLNPWKIRRQVDDQEQHEQRIAADKQRMADIEKLGPEFVSRMTRH